MDGISKCQDTPIPDGIPQRLARPYPEPQLSLKRTGEAHTSPDVIILQDPPVHSTAGGDVHCGSKCTSVHHNLEISVCDEDETCIPSPTALLDQRDISSSLSIEVAQCYFHIAQAPASGMGDKHSTQHDKKSHPPDKVSLNSPHSSVCTISPKGPLSADKLARVQSISSPHNLCITLNTDEKEECLNCMGDRFLDEESVHEYMAVPLITQDPIDQGPNDAQSPSLSKGLLIPVSHDENAHHVDPHNPNRVPPPSSKAKLSPTASHFIRTKSLLGRAVSYFLGNKSVLAMAASCMANKTCLACDVPNRYMVHCHKFLSQVDVSCDVLGESDLLQETASSVSGYMLHETSITTDSGYHSPHPTVPTHVDVSSSTMVPGSVNKVLCPFSQGEALVNLLGKRDEILSQVLCEDTGHPNVEVPGQVLPLASTPRVSRENFKNAASIFVPFGESGTFMEPNYPTTCNYIVHPSEENVLPSPIEFPGQEMTASHPMGVDGDLEDYVC